MPLYEYRCTACNRLTEKRQKFSDPEITDCPFCGGRLERTITAPAIQFKGGGWYADGYGNKKPAAAGSPDNKGADNATSTDSKNSETKNTDSKSSETSPSKPSTETGTAPAAASTPSPTPK